MLDRITTLLIILLAKWRNYLKLTLYSVRVGDPINWFQEVNLLKCHYPLFLWPYKSRVPLNIVKFVAEGFGMYAFCILSAIIYINNIIAEE